MMTTVAFLAPFLIWEVKMCFHILRLVHFLLGDKIQISTQLVNHTSISSSYQKKLTKIPTALCSLLAFRQGELAVALGAPIGEKDARICHWS